MTSSARAVNRVDGEVKEHRDETCAQAEDDRGSDSAGLKRKFLQGAWNQVGYNF